MSSQKKVYCKNCKHFRPYESRIEYARCNKNPSSVLENNFYECKPWKNRSYASIKNQNNGCKDFQMKFWINLKQILWIWFSWGKS